MVPPYASIFQRARAFPSGLRQPPVSAGSPAGPFLAMHHVHVFSILVSATTMRVYLSARVQVIPRLKGAGDRSLHYLVGVLPMNKHAYSQVGRLPDAQHPPRNMLDFKWSASSWHTFFSIIWATHAAARAASQIAAKALSSILRNSLHWSRARSENMQRFFFCNI